jgi:hypothetical protein
MALADDVSVRYTLHPVWSTDCPSSTGLAENDVFLVGGWLREALGIHFLTTSFSYNCQHCISYAPASTDKVLSLVAQVQLLSHERAQRR